MRPNAPSGRPDLDLVIMRAGFPLPDGLPRYTSRPLRVRNIRCAVCRQIGAKLTALGEWFEVRGQLAPVS